MAVSVAVQNASTARVRRHQRQHERREGEERVAEGRGQRKPLRHLRV